MPPFAALWNARHFLYQLMCEKLVHRAWLILALDCGPQKSNDSKPM